MLDLQLEVAHLTLMLLLQVRPGLALMVQAAHLGCQLLLQHCNVMPQLVLHKTGNVKLDWGWNNGNGARWKYTVHSGHIQQDLASKIPQATTSLTVSHMQMLSQEIERQKPMARKGFLTGADQYLQLAVLLDVCQAGRILLLAILFQGLCCFLQLSAAVLQPLNVILLLYDGALVLLLLCCHPYHVFPHALDL